MSPSRPEKTAATVTPRDRDIIAPIIRPRPKRRGASLAHCRHMDSARGDGDYCCVGCSHGNNFRFCGNGTKRTMLVEEERGVALSRPGQCRQLLFSRRPLAHLRILVRLLPPEHLRLPPEALELLAEPLLQIEPDLLGVSEDIDWWVPCRRSSGEGVPIVVHTVVVTPWTPGRGSDTRRSSRTGGLEGNASPGVPHMLSCRETSPGNTCHSRCTKEDMPSPPPHPSPYLASRSCAFCPAIAEAMLKSCCVRSNLFFPFSIAEDSWDLRLATLNVEGDFLFCFQGSGREC